MYDKFDEFVINRCVPNKMVLSAKNHGNQFRHFENVSRCEPSNIVASLLGAIFSKFKQCPTNFLGTANIQHFYRLKSVIQWTLDKEKIWPDH